MTEAMTPQRLEEIRTDDADAPADPSCPAARHRRELLAEVDRLTARVAGLERLAADHADMLETGGELGKQAMARLDQALARVAELEAERDRERQMLRYCYKRWPAVIFWQAAAQIDSPYTALPGWLTADEAAPDPAPATVQTEFFDRLHRVTSAEPEDADDGPAPGPEGDRP